MKELTKRLEEAGIESEMYSGFSANDNYELEEKIREDFGKQTQRWAQAQWDTTSNAARMWLWNHITRRNEQGPEKENYTGSHLAIVVHGLGENGKMFRELKQAGQSQGYTVVPISYNDKKDFEEYTKDVSEQIKRITDTSTFSDAFVIGHSTGTDVLRMINSQGGLEGFSGAALASGTINGHVPGLNEWILFQNKCAYHDPRTGRGQENIYTMQTPLSIPGVSIAFLNDHIVPMHTSLDMKGANLIVANYGHITGTGGHKVGNTVYLESLKELKNH